MKICGKNLGFPDQLKNLSFAQQQIFYSDQRQVTAAS